LAVRILQIDPSEGDIIRAEQQLFSLPAESVNSDTFYDHAIQALLRLIEEFIQNGSNWVIETVEWFDLRVTRYHSVPNKRGKCFVQLPPRLKDKHAVVNVNNGPQSDCFKYAVLSVLHYDEVQCNRDRPSSYAKWVNELNFSGLTFPINASDIPQFEKMVS